jgi:hypothetical protein
VELAYGLAEAHIPRFREQETPAGLRWDTEPMVESCVDTLRDLRLPFLGTPSAEAVVLLRNPAAAGSFQVRMSEQLVDHIVVGAGLVFQTVGCAVDLDRDKAARFHSIADGHVVAQLRNALKAELAKGHAFVLSSSECLASFRAISMLSESIQAASCLALRELEWSFQPQSLECWAEGATNCDEGVQTVGRSLIDYSGP